MSRYLKQHQPLPVTKTELGAKDLVNTTLPIPGNLFAYGACAEDPEHQEPGCMCNCSLCMLEGSDCRAWEEA